MGVTTDAAKFLIQARSAGVRFAHTLTLGHQHLFANPQKLEKLLKQHNCLPADFDQETFYKDFYADSLFKLLGAEEFSSMDASTYEGANVIHDLNDPISTDLHEKFDLVFDGGTLEHVFNFPVAVKNCMEMVKVGGHLILFVVANNYLGHGLYQFSPELFFRTLSEENGFAVERMVALENDVWGSDIMGKYFGFEITGPWYEINDPDLIKERVLLISKEAVVLLVQAKRIARAPIFSRYPQQSDYSACWDAAKTAEAHAPVAGASRMKGMEAWLRQRLSPQLRRHLRWTLLPGLLPFLDPFRLRRRAISRSFGNRKLYKQVND